MKLKKRNDVFFVCVEMKENADRVNPSIEENQYWNVMSYYNTCTYCPVL